MSVVAAAVTAVGVTGLTASGASADTPVPIATDGVKGIDFAGGVLATVERAAAGYEWVFVREVSADGTMAGDREDRGFASESAGGAGAERVPCDAGRCVPLRSTGNGHVGYFRVAGGSQRAEIHVSSNGLYGDAEEAVTGGKFVDVTGRFYVYNAASTGKQYIDYVPAYRSQNVRMVRNIAASSVWGTRLWTANAAAGSVSALDLKKKMVVETVGVGAPCTVKELQAIGRWLYWNCGPDGPAGVYDHTTKQKITVPSGPALVGDGYLVRHDRAAGKLLLTDFHTGTAAAPRAIADVPTGTVPDQRRLTWSVDKFGGDIAYVGRDNAVHVVQSGVPAQPLGRIDSDLDEVSVDLKSPYGNQAWMSTWQLSKPAHWTFTVRDALGRTVRTIKGAKATTEPDVTWDGRTDTGQYVHNGKHRWTLSTTAADGSGTYTTSADLSVYGGLQGYHDQGGTAHGDVVTLNGSGTLTNHIGNGAGGFGGKNSGGGWPAGTYAVPFGDTGKDRCAELLVRMPNGELRRYTGKCGGAYTPGSGHYVYGRGWQQYNVLTSPGDLNGDGRSDLIARQTTTGDLYFYAQTTDGKFAARVRIGGGWNTYGRITGAGDLTGDGRADLLAHDRNGGLWRYDGLGNGKFATRKQVFTDWGRSYNAIIGVGDISGDGRADLLVRDSAGNLYRNNGNGKGSFSGRVQLATGWQTYKGIF
ncbi:VCBS repeat-containing protein [Streptomyces sp. TRM66268-LWL]|uniref:VCBS repeat-containing protein n=1 Tax=Streptomyces polyasparticus TaxID=2767826 RepID=A0ABR7SXL0_9ACTN|nr:FG-GAP-like repeat-containing protein [Streptomyces polyasparticus]MBC9719083.1 VCBS repeat-containing protein [Streptomyces polyasparticus]